MMRPRPEEIFDTENATLPADGAAALTAGELRALADEELVERALQGEEELEKAPLDELFARYYPKVSAWGRRFSGDVELAGDIAQETFLRVHTRLHTFRGESRFSTWLYVVTRSTAINMMRKAGRRKSREGTDPESIPEPRAPGEPLDDRLATGQLAEKLRQAIQRDLTPNEQQVLYLHHVDGMTLPAITEMLAFDNKSGAKAYLVAAKRKLSRNFGTWLAEQ